MSRIGKNPVKIPAGVSINIEESRLNATGPKGTLGLILPAGISVRQDVQELIVERQSDEAAQRARHGLYRSLIANMIKGVSDGYEVKLEIHGVGYRVQSQGSDLKFNLGYSHDVVYKVPVGVSVSIDQNIIIVSGIDKQSVGQVAAEIRALKKPEPYKGKGIKYADERIIRKSGKSGKEQ